MRALALLAIFVALIGAMQDFNCLKKCSKAHKKGVNCLAKCELTSKNFNKPANRLKKTKKPAHVKPVGKPIGKHLTPKEKAELEALKKEEELDLKTEHSLEEEIKEDAQKISRERADIEKKRREAQKEDHELLQELRKEAAARRKLIEIEHDAARTKLKEELDEHGQALMAKHGPVKIKKLPKAGLPNYACLRGCLMAIHNGPVCHKRCAPKKPKVVTAAQRLALKRKKAKIVAKLKKHEAKALAGGCGPCYGAQQKKGQCCNSCDAVKKAYAKKHWMLPPLTRMVQCKTEAKVEKRQKKVVKHRIFRHTTARAQHSINKVIHHKLFKNMKRHTVAKGHFAPHKKSKAELKAKRKRLDASALATVHKWEKYRAKRYKGAAKPVVVPGLMKRMKPGAKVVKHATVLHQQGAVMHMDQHALRKWQMLKIHHWAAPKASLLKVKVIKAKKAALRAAKKNRKIMKPKKKKTKTATKPKAAKTTKKH